VEAATDRHRAGGGELARGRVVHLGRRQALSGVGDASDDENFAGIQKNCLGTCAPGLGAEPMPIRPKRVNVPGLPVGVGVGAAGDAEGDAVGCDVAVALGVGVGETVGTELPQPATRTATVRAKPSRIVDRLVWWVRPA